MKTEVLDAKKPGWLDRALEVLRRGGIVAFPTDTVYGLGALAFVPRAVARLYQAKGRATEKAIPVLLAGLDDLPRVAPEPSEMARKLAQRFWPGPVTLVVPRHPELPQAVSPTPTVGVRVPDHPVALRLLAATGPMAVTSANRAGAPSARTAAQVLAELEGRIDIVIDGGETPGGEPSTVADCTGERPVILRKGPVTAEEIVDALA